LSSSSMTLRTRKLRLSGASPISTGAYYHAYSSVAPMSVAALIISIVALLVSTGQWILNGPWIVIGSRSGIVANQLDHPECLILIANNRGRLPATIHQW